LTRTPDGTPVRDSPGSEPGRPHRLRSAAWFLAPFAVFSLLGLLWALGSPVFSVPDENAHATKAIAQVRGQVVGYTLPDVRHIVVDLPPGYEYSPEMLCFTTHSETPASCAPALGDPGGQDWFNTWVGAYNPVYYALVGWPSLLFDGNASVYAMRVASVLLGAALLAWAFQAAVLGRRALWAGVTVAAVVLVNARALGPLWLVIIVGACFLASGWGPVKALFTTGASYVWLAIIAAGGLFSVGWTLTGGSLSGQADAADAPLVGGTFLQGFLHTIRGTNDYMHQAIGFFGWMDAPLPVWAYWFFIAAFAVLVVLAATATRRRSVLVLAAVVLAAIVVPAVVQGASVNQTGIIWQGRYALFLYLGIAIIAGWLLSRDAARIDFLAPRITWVGAALIAAYGVIAYALVMVRYVIGGEASLGEMVSAPQWQPPLGWPALTVGYLLASLALVALVGVAGTVVARRDPLTDAPVAAPAAEGTPARG